jgi:hypothetical protein
MSGAEAGEVNSVIFYSFGFNVKMAAKESIQ